ncbi:MAG TPA: thioredoxin domain-containing protein [Trueperaceae bacterium]
MSNRLAGSLSLYLRQHANDPVHWYPWGDEAFALARQTQRPVFLSAGYSSCHWCHVMARESFRDPAVAELLNAGFVSIKVDREERPDIDDYYMTAAQAMTGAGGWPLSVFLTPDGKPFHAGTYYPPVDRHGMPSFTRLLRAVMAAWTERRDEVIDSAERIAESIGKIGGPLLTGLDLQAGAPDDVAASVEAAQSAALRALAAQEDEQNGGFGDPRGGPKFPPHSALAFLLSAGGDTALQIVRRALDAMARGGLYDHLAGGFFRYSVDPAWRVPHFEKMLYDNAQLARAYALGYAATGEERYREVALGVLAWLDAEMLQVPASGLAAYSSALDADSEGEEGRFYAWTEQDFRAALMPEGESVTRATALRFGITATGDFEGGNVLRLAALTADVAAAMGLESNEIGRLVGRGVDALSTARARRVRPATDDKVLTSWNGLVVSTLSAIGMATGETKALERGLEMARFLVGLREDGRLLHMWRAGETRGAGLLEDHVFLGNGLLDLYGATLEPWLLTEALRLADDVDAHFADAVGGGWFDTADWLAGAPAQLKSHTDGAVPSRYVAAARLTWRAGRLLSDAERIDRAVSAVLPLARAAAEAPQALGSALALLAEMARPEREVVLVGSRGGSEMPAILRAVREGTGPGDVLLLLDPADERGGSHPLADLPLTQGRYPPEGGRATVYVCRGGACRLPVHDADGVRRAMLAA